MSKAKGKARYFWITAAGLFTAGIIVMGAQDARIRGAFIEAARTNTSRVVVDNTFPLTPVDCRIAWQEPANSNSASILLAESGAIPQIWGSVCREVASTEGTACTVRGRSLEGKLVVCFRNSYQLENAGVSPAASTL